MVKKRKIKAGFVCTGLKLNHVDANSPLELQSEVRTTGRAVWCSIYCFLYIKVIQSLNRTLIENNQVKRKGMLASNTYHLFVEAFRGID